MDFTISVQLPNQWRSTYCLKSKSESRQYILSYNKTNFYSRVQHKSDPWVFGSVTTFLT